MAEPGPPADCSKNGMRGARETEAMCVRVSMPHTCLPPVCASSLPLVSSVHDAVGVQRPRADAEALALGALAVAVDVVQPGAGGVVPGHHCAL